MASFDLENYATVQERIAAFYADFPDGSIRTNLAVRDGAEIVFEARVYRTPEEAATGIYTSGWAREIEGANPINRTSHLEAGETSSIGRALSNLGYATDKRRPSREELLKTRRMEQEHEAALDEIRAAGRQVPDGARAMIAGEEIELRDFVLREWGAIKARPSLARAIADAMRAATHGVDAAP